MRTRALTLLLAVTCVAGMAVLAQQPPPPTFKSGTTFVQIDAIVTDRDGRLAPGLTKDDFELFEDGKAKTIAAFTLVRVPVERSAASAGPDPDVASNRVPFNGRVFLLLLDDVHTAPIHTTSVRKAAREFVERHMAANDLAAVVFASGQAVGQDLTSSRPRLVATIERFVGRKLMSATSAAAEDREMNRYVLPTDNPPPGLAAFTMELRILRGKGTLVALGRLAEFLGRIPGPRKTLVYFSEGVDVWATGAGRDPTEVREALREGIAAAGRGNVSIYPIGRQGLSAASGGEATEMQRAADMRWKLAEETGGIAFPDSNDVSSSLARIVEDSSAYYLLGYYAPPGRDDRFRKVDVRVKRAGLTVRARAGYYPRGTGDPPKTTTGAGTQVSKELREVLRSPLASHGIVFSAAAAPFRGTAAKASVALALEIDPGALRFSTRGATRSTDIEVQVTATDPDAKTPVHSMHHLVELRLRPETHEAVVAGGVRITRRLELAPGSYRVQIGVRDKTSGAVGTLFMDVDVPDFSRPPLAMSGLVLVSAAATRVPTAAPDTTLSAILPGAQTSRREFPTNDTLVVFAEVYRNDPAASPRILVKTTVRDDTGADAFTTTSEYVGVPARQGSQGDRVTHQVTIPASTLRPGRYVLRVEASPTPAGEPRVMREAPFTIR
jgi:VWFA-related protein